MAPRLHCLNAVRHVVRTADGCILTSRFSTSSRVLADPPFSSSSFPSEPAPSSSSPQTRLPRRFDSQPSPQNDSSSSSSPLSSSSWRSPLSQRAPRSPDSASSSIMRLIEKQSQRTAASRQSRDKLSSTSTTGSASTLSSSRSTLSSQMNSHARSLALGRQIHRKWQAGDVYAPHDLSPAELQKYQKTRAPAFDAFDVLSMDPVEQYKNYSMMAEYVSPMGRLKHHSETGLRAKNQRRLAKAVRRIVGMGLAPGSYWHPEILQINAKKVGSGGRGRGFGGW